MDTPDSLDVSRRDSTSEVIPQDMNKDRTEEKPEKTQNSFYECPTAACSIASVNALQEPDNPSTPDLNNEYSLEGFEDDRVDVSQVSSTTTFYNSQRISGLSSEGDSVSYSTLQRAQGGYFAGSPTTLLQGAPVESERPRSFINRPLLSGSAPLDQQPPVLRMLMASPSSTPKVSIGGRLLNAESTVFTMDADSSVSRTMEPTVTQLPATRHSEISPVNRPNSSVSPAVKDYSRAIECGNSSETSFVHEGYDTIQIPRYRPVEVIDKVVEVPVVHHVDTYVPKKEIQEIESIVKKPYIKYVDKIVEVPEIHYTDKIVEVPEYHEVTKTVTKVEVQERVKYMPKVEVKVVPKYVEVPVVKIVDRYEEYEEVEEIVKEVEKIEIVEVPREVVKHVVKPVKKIIEQERIVPITEHRDVPIEKVKFVPKIETVELIREIPKVIDVPVPYNVPKVEYVDKPYVVPEYRDVQVAVPVRKKVTPVYHYQGEPEVIDVPIHRPYFVIHDHITFKPASQPIAENMKVVGVRPIDLNGLSESERVEAQNRLRNAVRNPIPDGGNVVHSPSSAQASPVVDTTNVVIVPQSYAPNVAQHISTNVELPSKAMATPMEPHFGIAKTPSRKSDRPSGSIETIIYKNHKNAPVSPMSDIGHGDVYPRSSNNTPRMIS